MITNMKSILLTFLSVFLSIPIMAEVDYPDRSIVLTMTKGQEYTLTPYIDTGQTSGSIIEITSMLDEDNNAWKHYLLSNTDAFSVNENTKTVKNKWNYSITVYDYSITPLNTGTYTFKQTVRWGTAMNVYDDIVVTYIINVVDVVSISIPNNLNLTIGEKYTFSPIIMQQGVATSLSWSSSKTSVATISSSGVLTAVASGQTVITCQASNGVSALSVVTVSPAAGVTGIVIPAELNLEVSEQFLFTPIVMGEANATLTWKASNSNVSISPSGSMKASKVGKSVITCTAPNGVAAMCIVNVGPLLTQDIQIAVGPHQMTADNTWLSVGQNEVLSPVFTPRNATNRDVIFMSSNDLFSPFDSP